MHGPQSSLSPLPYTFVHLHPPSLPLMLPSRSLRPPWGARPPSHAQQTLASSSMPNLQASPNETSPASSSSSKKFKFKMPWKRDEDGVLQMRDSAVQALGVLEKIITLAKDVSSVANVAGLSAGLSGVAEVLRGIQVRIDYIYFVAYQFRLPADDVDDDRGRRHAQNPDRRAVGPFRRLRPASPRPAHSRGHAIAPRRVSAVGILTVHSLRCLKILQKMGGGGDRCSRHQETSLGEAFVEKRRRRC